jgi:hypothetical protein
MSWVELCSSFYFILLVWAVWLAWRLSTFQWTIPQGYIHICTRCRRPIQAWYRIDFWAVLLHLHVVRTHGSCWVGLPGATVHPRQFRAGCAATAATHCLPWTRAWHEPEVSIVHAWTFSNNCVMPVLRLHAMMLCGGRGRKSPRLLCIDTGWKYMVTFLLPPFCFPTSVRRNSNGKILCPCWESSSGSPAWVLFDNSGVTDLRRGCFSCSTGF